eukprot:Gb_13202 [translate_table: standard]
MEASWSCWECLERLIPTVALQLAAVAYGVNLFSEPLKDLKGCMVKLLECLRNPGRRFGIVTGLQQRVCEWQPWIVFGKTSKILAAMYDFGRSADGNAMTKRSRSGGVGVMVHNRAVDVGEDRSIVKREQSRGGGVHRRINGNNAWPLAPVWLGVRNSTVEN